jgi:hypothetical protein
LPSGERCASEVAERGAGCEVALDVEVVVDGGMYRKKNAGLIQVT